MTRIILFHCESAKFCVNYLQIAEVLLQKGSEVNVRDNHGSTPLHRAACKGLLKMVKLLLSYNANPNQLDGTGCSAL